jgi:hypothetical protein
MGMQRVKPPTGAAEIIQDLASKGYGYRGIAATFKISAPTLSRWFDDYPTIKQAYDIGKEEERQALHGALYRQATGAGNVVAAIFLLKARHGYRENEVVSEGNKVNITFNLPGAMKPDEYKTLEAVAIKRPAKLEASND